MKNLSGQKLKAQENLKKLNQTAGMTAFAWLWLLPMKLLLCTSDQDFLCSVLSLKTSNQNAIKLYCLHRIFGPIDLTTEQFRFSEYN